MKLKSSTIRVLISILVFMTLISCEKEEENSQPLSNFSANINGIPFYASDTYCELRADSFLKIRTFAIVGQYQGKYLTVAFMDTVLTQVVDNTTSINWLISSMGYSDTLSTQYYFGVNTNLIFSKFDTISKITSGSFSGVISDSTQTETLNITDGKFTDIKYEWIQSH